MMNDLLKIQSELDRRPKQMKPENKNSQIEEEEPISGIIEPNPYLASPRLLVQNVLLMNGSVDLELFNCKMRLWINCKYLSLKQFIIISFDKVLCDLLLKF